MKTDELLEQISKEGPQRPLMSPVRQTMLWLVGVLIYLGMFSAVMGFRADIGQKLASTNYILELCLLLAIGVSSTMAAFCLSRPDAHQKPWIKIIPFAFLIPLILITVNGLDNSLGGASISESLASNHLDCPLHIFMFTVPPALVLFLIVRMGATIQCCWAGTMATLSVTSFAYILMRLIEQTDDVTHLLIWHALPIVLMCMVGMILGQITLKWRFTGKNKL